MKRPLWMIAAIGVVALLVIALLWFYVIPRTELKVTTVYHEGSTNTINVNVKLENAGTVDVKDLVVDIVLWNDTYTFIDESQSIKRISPGGSKQIATYFFGDQYGSYHIAVNVTFESNGVHFYEKFTHSNGRYMTEQWEDSVSKVHL